MTLAIEPAVWVAAGRARQQDWLRHSVEQVPQLAARIRNAMLHVVDDCHLFLVACAKDVKPPVRAFLLQESS